MKLRTLSTGAIVAGVLASAPFAATSPALAVPAPNGAVNVLALAGSDTTQDVDGALAAAYNTSPRNPAPRDRAVNIPALSTGSVTVPADAFCGSRTYSSTPGDGQFAAPNGSSAGRAALRSSVEAGDGCIDIARSSSGPSSSDPASFEYYSYARDAVSYVSFPNSAAPRTLTTAQLRGIYNCTFTNWRQVGGGTGPIQRFIPQAGSGTRSFFISTVLGGADPTAVSTAACPAVREVQENSGTAVPTSFRGRAILPYSAAQFIAQGNDVVTDVRAGSRMNAIDNLNPVVVNGQTGALSPNLGVYRNPNFIGGRDVYHVVDNRSRSYGDALRFVGFDIDGPGAVCSGAFNAQITRFGFAPNANANSTQGICRLS